MDASYEKISHIIRVFLDKGENISQEAEIVSGVYGRDTATDNRVILMSKMHHALEGHLSKISIENNGDYRVRPSCKHCFDWPGDKHCTKDHLEALVTSINRKRLQSNCGGPAQIVANGYVIGGIRSEAFTIAVGQTLNADLYSQQLEGLNKSIARKRPALESRRGIVLH